MMIKSKTVIMINLVNIMTRIPRITDTSPEINEDVLIIIYKVDSPTGQEGIVQEVELLTIQAHPETKIMGTNNLNPREVHIGKDLVEVLGEGDLSLVEPMAEANFCTILIICQDWDTQVKRVYCNISMFVAYAQTEVIMIINAIMCSRS